MQDKFILVQTIQNHNYQDGDEVNISKVVGLEFKNSQLIEVVDVKSFKINNPTGVTGDY